MLGHQNLSHLLHVGCPSKKLNSLIWLKCISLYLNLALPWTWKRKLNHTNITSHLNHCPLRMCTCTFLYLKFMTSKHMHTHMHVRTHTHTALHNVLLSFTSADYNLQQKLHLFINSWHKKNWKFFLERQQGEILSFKPVLSYHLNPCSLIVSD